MSTEDTKGAEVVAHLVRLAPPAWLRIVLNCEAMDDDTAGTILNSKFFAVVDRDGDLQREHLDLDAELTETLRDWRARSRAPNGGWSTVDIEVDVDGRRDVDVSHGEPKRLSGVRDYESFGRFVSYISDHRSELDELARTATTSAAGLDEQGELVQAVVQRFATVAPEAWARLAGNWEAYRDDDGTLTLNYITVAVVNGGTEWLYGQVGYDHVLYDAVLRLNERMAGGDEQRRWTVFDLEVDADPPEFRVDFGYDTPKRVNGIDDHESIGRFRDYLQTWIDQHGPTPDTGGTNR